MRELPAMTENHGSRGFFTHQETFILVIIMAVIYSLIIPRLARWIDSGALLAVVGVLLIVPVGLVASPIAYVLWTALSREKQEEEGEEEPKS